MEGEEVVDIYSPRSQDRRRRPRDKKRIWDPKALWEQHHEMLNLKAMGMRNTDIAKATGVTPVLVSGVVNSSLGMEKVAILRGARDADAYDVTKKIGEITQKAVRLLEDVIDDPNEMTTTKISVAKMWLRDMSGIAAAKRVDVHATTVNGKDLVEIIKERGREAARACGMLVSE